MAETLEQSRLVIEHSVQHAGRKRAELKAEVMALEKEAEQILGGPVVRSHRFEKPKGEKCTFIWRRVV